MVKVTAAHIARLHIERTATVEVQPVQHPALVCPPPQCTFLVFMTERA